MTREAAQQEILRIVRDELLVGSERPLPLDAPLGEVGVGLDSLALVNLVAALEATLGIDLPDDIWTARGALSIGDLAEIAAEAPRSDSAVAATPGAPTSLHGRMERIQHALAGGGPARRAAWAVVRALAPVKRFALARSRHVVLERRLDDLAAIEIPPRPGIVLRPYAPADEGGLAGLWPPFADRDGRRFLRRSLREGATALVAAEGSRIVALDLISATGEDEIELDRSTNACYGYYLTEAPAVRGRGIGVALVAYSLHVARERGFRTQLTHVAEDNATMLAAATQLLGFRRIGSARRTRVMGLTRWSWEVDGRSGRAARLLL